MTVHHCDRHGFQYRDTLDTDASCPKCRQERLAASAPDLTTLEREVVEQAELMWHVFAEKFWEISDPAGRDVMARATALADMLNAAEALRAARQLKAVRPEEVEPGTRFKWAEGCNRDYQLDECMVMRDQVQVAGAPPRRCFTMDDAKDWRVYIFDPDDLVIPSPEQD